jgi:Mitochondrial carrier protein
MACLIRVPTEVVKQRMQAGVAGHTTFVEATKIIMQREGPIGFYTGFGITVMREIPFSLVQFPVYEYLKVRNSVPNLVLALHSYMLTNYFVIVRDRDIILYLCVHCVSPMSSLLLLSYTVSFSCYPSYVSSNV